ncbi:hypothetical protein ABPG75_010814 [Micractinium tetrahymenae]
MYMLPPAGSLSVHCSSGLQLFPIATDRRPASFPAATSGRARCKRTMGAGFSKGNSVWLQTDKPVYHDGDWVQGLVCLNVVQPVTITTIDCELRGVEHTYWTETHESGTGSNRHSHTEMRGGTVHLLNVTHPLGGAGRELAPGQYQWQVVFGLPVGIPSSFKVGSGTDGAEVTYTVNLTFHTPGFLTRAIRSSQVLTVRQRMKAPAAIVGQSAELPLAACCCFNRGMLSAHVRLDRDRVQPGEEVGVVLEVDNKSKLPVDGIELSLKREVVARERPSGGTSRRFHSEMARTQHPGVQPFTTLQGGLAKRMQMRLPADLPPSMRGAIITCDYSVKVKMKIGSFVKDIKLKVPLVVLAPQPQPTAEAPFYEERPPWWSPSEVQPPVGIQVPSAPALPPELLKPGGCGRASWAGLLLGVLASWF